MKDNEQPTGMSRESSRFFSGGARKLNSHGQEPMEPVEDVEDDDIRSTGSWRNSRSPLLAVAVERENRNAPSLLYGGIVGAPYLDPSRGIQFIYEGVHCEGWGKWKVGRFLVSIAGANLEGIRNRLNAGVRAVIRENSEERDGIGGGLGVRIGDIVIEPWDGK